MATCEHALTCTCGAKLKVFDRSEHSFTTTCTRWCGSWLIVQLPGFNACVPLAELYVEKHDRWPFLADAPMILYEDLRQDRWPKRVERQAFGIRTGSHFNALQFVVRAGVSSYELGRVLGDGPAITQLVLSAPGQPYTSVVFRTWWDTIRRIQRFFERLGMDVVD